MNDPADFLEDASDHLVIRMEHYLFDNVNISPTKYKIIQEFVEWCIKEDQKDLDIPRAPDKTSFRQRRRDKINHKMP
jgi:hypothetical protein